MPPTVKESDTNLLHPPANNRSESPARPQPVAVEVPVTLNGVRTLDSSDKREPFSETSKTVLIFATGAVVRLSSTVMAGQLLFLTNDKTQKEVVCQVVKSKNYRNVSGYVELEFTESMPGFWGMRFPSDHSAVSSPAPLSAAIKSESASSSLPQSESSRFPVAPLAPATDTNARVAAPKENLAKPNLSSVAPKASASLPSAGATTSGKDAVNKVVEIPKAPSVAAKPARPVNDLPVTMQSTLDLEEVKIPSWLEPLARNTAAPLAEPERQSDEMATFIQELSAVLEEDVANPPQETVEHQPEPASAVETVDTVPVVVSTPKIFGGALLEGDSFASQQTSSPGNKKMILGAIAAAILLVAGAGAWYLHSSAKFPSAAVIAPNVPPTTPAITTTSPPQTDTLGNSPISDSNQPNVVTMPAVTSAHVPSAQPAVVSTVVTRPEPNAMAPTHSAAQPPAAPPPKKSILNVLAGAHFAASAANRDAGGANTTNGEVAPEVSGGQLAPGADALSGGLASAHNKQPMAPLPVGGDVKPARVLKSVPPVYPAMAKSRNVAGDVQVDATIDVTGEVTAMKVLSGPSLLHQAAMDALHQWKYQAATLDGKPVPMHMTVTIQFRLQ